MGLAPRDDPYGVRWVAVRHGLSVGGIDHIHIAATLARQDGTLPRIHNDFLRARTACQSIEQQFGLTTTAPADRTAAVRPTRAEAEQARRRAGKEPRMVTLRRLVQEAAAAAVGEQDFFARLRDAGALIRERRSTTDHDQVTGYAVALPSQERAGDPVWFGGGKLAPDLTLPRLRRRWERPGTIERGTGLSAPSARAILRDIAGRAARHAQDEQGFFARLADPGVLAWCRYSDRDPARVTGYALTLPGHHGTDGAPVWYSGGRLADGLALPALRRHWGSDSAPAGWWPDPTERRALWADIIRLTSATAEQFRTDPQATADTAGATADALRIAARTIRGQAGRDLREAAGNFDRAAREAYGRVPAPSPSGQALRVAVRLLDVLVGAGWGDLGTLVTNLAALAAATAELRHLQDRAHQAAAARAATERLYLLAVSARHQAPTPEQERRMKAAIIARQDHAEPSRELATQHPTAPRNGRRQSRPGRARGPAP
jgi:hypothetical protein